MLMYFSTNENEEVNGMATTRIGERKNPIEVNSETLEELKTNMSKFKIIKEKLVKSNELELKNAKEKKKEELNKACQQAILNGFESKSNGINYSFSYDRESQLNFQDTYNLFQNNLSEKIGWTVRLEEKKMRIELDKKTFLSIYTDAIKHKNENISHLYNKLIPKLEAAKTYEETQLVIWEKNEQLLEFNTDNMLDKKINEISMIEKETSAQKGHNVYIETSMMEVMDIIFSGF